MRDHCITEKVGRGVINEVQYAHDLVLMSETMEDLGLKVYIRKTKVMVSRLERELFKSKMDLCGVCGK